MKAAFDRTRASHFRGVGIRRCMEQVSARRFPGLPVLPAVFVFGFSLWVSGAIAGKIAIRDVTVTPRRAAAGTALTLTVTAESSGVSCTNFRIRTPYRASSGDVPRGFRIEKASGFAVFADHPSGNLLDNGPGDADLRDGRLKTQLSTAELAEGVHYLAVFAHNRPTAKSEDHVVDYRNLEIVVRDGTVSARVLERGEGGLTGRVRFDVFPLTVAVGTPLVCTVDLRGRSGVVTSAPVAIRLRSPYTVSRDEVLPGFVYDAEEKRAFIEDSPDHLIRDNGPLDTDLQVGVVRLSVPTAGWPAGCHALTLELASEELRLPYGTTKPYRDVLIDVPGPTDQFTVTLGDPVVVASGTHFSALVSLGEGRIYTGEYISEDWGRTWRPAAAAMPRPNRLPDGRLIATRYRALPVPGKEGEFTGRTYWSADGGKTVSTAASRVLVPLGTGALGHGPHVGPLFGRSVVRLRDGSLLSSMYGWFKGDSQADRYRKGGTMRRSYVCRSTDEGRTWEYLSTVAYRPFLGNEGYSELVIRKLSSADELLALVRTGGNNTPGWQDNPLMVSRSLDGGITWSPVARTGVEGVWPDLCIMSTGTLVCSTGRPGAFIMFSTDGGRTWTDHTPIDGERYSGYTAVCELRPGELLVGYGVQQGFDPATGTRRNQLRVVPVRVQRK